MNKKLEEKPNRKRSNGSRTDRARQGLLNMIHSRKLLPGQILEERRLATQLGVSRTPLRAALSVLEGERLLERQSNRALRIVEVTLEDYLEILHLRKALEGLAASQAAARIPAPHLLRLKQRTEKNLARQKPSLEEHLSIDFELHDIIAAASGNRLLRAIINDLHRRARLGKIDRVPLRIVASGKDHMTIIDALLKGDSKRAKAAMIAHIENVTDNVLNQLKQH